MVPTIPVRQIVLDTVLSCGPGIIPPWKGVVVRTFASTMAVEQSRKRQTHLGVGVIGSQLLTTYEIHNMQGPERSVHPGQEHMFWSVIFRRYRRANVRYAKV